MICYADAIVANTTEKQWALRYFAAQTYVDLFGKTGDSAYLRKAFDITLDNVNTLVDKQHSMNTAYMSPIVEVKAEKGAMKAEQEEIKQYNKMLKEIRKTELPPIYEPLMLNCELLFALSHEMEFTNADKTTTSDIVHHDGIPLFLNESLDQLFTFDASTISVTDIDISFDGRKIDIPARYVTTNSSFRLTVRDGLETYAFDDFVIEKVERKKEGDLDSYRATYTSKAINQFHYGVGMTMSIELIPYADIQAQPLIFSYEAVADEKWWIVPDGIKYQRIN